MHVGFTVVNINRDLSMISFTYDSAFRLLMILRSAFVLSFFSNSFKRLSDFIKMCTCDFTIFYDDDDDNNNENVHLKTN